MTDRERRARTISRAEGVIGATGGRARNDDRAG